MSESLTINVEAVLERTHLKLEFLLLMIDQSLPFMRERLDALREAVTAVDNTQVAAEAHAIKGSAAAVGMEEVQQLAFTLERLGKGIIGGDAEAELSRLEAALQRATDQAELLKAAPSPTT